MAKEVCVHDEVTPGVMAIIELTATRVADKTINEYETRLVKNLPRKECSACMATMAESTVKGLIKDHANDCPFKRIMWMCLGGSAVLSVLGSFLFNAIRLKMELTP